MRSTFIGEKWSLRRLHAEMEKQILESLDKELVRLERWRPVQPDQ